MNTTRRPRSRHTFAMAMADSVFTRCVSSGSSSQWAVEASAAMCRHTSKSAARKYSSTASGDEKSTSVCETQLNSSASAL